MNFIGFLGFSQFYPSKPFTQFFPGKYHLVFPIVNTTLANPASGWPVASRLWVLVSANPRNGIHDAGISAYEEGSATRESPLVWRKTANLVTINMEYDNIVAFICDDLFGRSPEWGLEYKSLVFALLFSGLNETNWPGIFWSETICLRVKQI